MTTQRALLLVVVAALVAALAVKFRSRRAPAAPSKPDEVEEWGRESFPASDPPSHW